MAACADLSTHGQRTIIRLATELSSTALTALQQIAPQLFSDVTEIGWQDSGQFIAQLHQQLGQIRLRSQRLPELNAEQWQAAWQHFIQQRGLDCLPWSTEALNLRARIAIDYTLQPPILAVKLQEMFGYEDQPSVLNGQLPLLIHLLSPCLSTCSPQHVALCWSPPTCRISGETPTQTYAKRCEAATQNTPGLKTHSAPKPPV